jgi:DHA1 family tetracycline resistance protein-like MFS transporter
LAGQVHPSTWSYFTIHQFNWSQKEVGFSLAFVGLMVAIVQGGLNRILIPKLGEKRSVTVGLLFYSFGFLLFGLATQGWMMYAFMVPFALSGVAGPSLQGIISKQVGPSQQGELQGALTSLISLTTIVGPIVATRAFAYFTSADAPMQVPGAAFFIASVMALISLFIALKAFKKNNLT